MGLFSCKPDGYDFCGEPWWSGESGSVYHLRNHIINRSFDIETKIEKVITRCTVHNKVKEETIKYTNV